MPTTRGDGGRATRPAVRGEHRHVTPSLLLLFELINSPLLHRRILRYLRAAITHKPRANNCHVLISFFRYPPHNCYSFPSSSKISNTFLLLLLLLFTPTTLLLLLLLKPICCCPPVVVKKLTLVAISLSAHFSFSRRVLLFHHAIINVKTSSRRRNRSINPNLPSF